MSIDTLSIARELRATELTGPQADAIAAAIGRSIDEGTVGKSDIALLERKLDAVAERLEAPIAAFRAETQAELRAGAENSIATKAEIKADLRAASESVTAKVETARSTLLTWLTGVILATAGVIIAILRL